MRLGIADHLGWAVAVTASADHGVVDRRRIELVEPGVSPAPITTRAGVSMSPPRPPWSRTCERRSFERRQLRSTRSPRRCPPPSCRSSLRDWPPNFPDDIAVQRRAPYEARADAVMYRRVLSELAHARGWSVHLYDAKDVVDLAIGMLGERAHEVLHGPRAAMGPP